MTGPRAKLEEIDVIHLFVCTRGFMVSVDPIAEDKRRNTYTFETAKEAVDFIKETVGAI